MNFGAQFRARRVSAPEVRRVSQERKQRESGIGDGWLPQTAQLAMPRYTASFAGSVL